MLSTLRQRRSLATKLWRGQLPDVRHPATQGFRRTILRALLFGAVGCVIAWGLSLILEIKYLSPQLLAHIGFNVGCLVGILFPYVIVLWHALRQRQKPNFRLLKYFSVKEKLIANAFLALVLMQLITVGYSWLDKHYALGILSSKQFDSRILPMQRAFRADHEKPPSVAFEIKLYVWMILLLTLSWLTRRLAENPLPNRLQQAGSRKAIENNALPFGLWLGESTGYLASRWHTAGLAPHQQVGIFHDDTAQNIVILGAIGSGKTTRAIHPLLLQLLDQGCGGLIFDIKADFKQAVAHYADLTQRTYTALGVGHLTCNLLHGLTPEIAASFLKSTLLLGGSSRQDSFWVDTAGELCRHALGVLAFLPEHYTLQGLYSYLFDPNWQQDLTEQLAIIAPNLPPQEQRLLTTYQHYENAVFSQFDEKVRAGVKATIAQILSTFNHPDLITAFCTEQPNSPQFEQLLEGDIFLVDLPLARWGVSGKVAYTFLKLRFFNLMQNRATEPTWNQSRYVFFMCDEYQDIVSANKEGLSDLNFWDKSRSSKTIGIISAQSISSFYAAIGDQAVANTILQNFRQKLSFRTEDQLTIDYFNRLLGSVEITRIASTQSQGNTSGKNGSRHQGTSTTLSQQERPLIDGQVFRLFGKEYALATLSYNGQAYDDILKTDAYYV